MTKEVTAVLVAVLLPAAQGAAQDVRAGERVRLTGPSVPGSPATGTLIESQADDLIVRLDSGGGSLMVPRTSLVQLEVVRGKRSEAEKGFNIGFVTGAVAGSVVGLYGSALCGLGGEPCGGGIILGVGMIGGVAGGALGALFGWATPSDEDRWRRVPTGARRVEVGLVPAPGLGAGVRVRF